MHRQNLKISFFLFDNLKVRFTTDLLNWPFEFLSKSISFLCYYKRENYIFLNKNMYSYSLQVFSHSGIFHIVIDRNTWHHLTVCKKMSSGSFNNVIYKIFTNHTYSKYMYKDYLALNNLRGLLYHKSNQPTNQPSVCVCLLSKIFSLN